MTFTSLVGAPPSCQASVTLSSRSAVMMMWLYCSLSIRDLSDFAFAMYDMDGDGFMTLVRAPARVCPCEYGCRLRMQLCVCVCELALGCFET